jgi:hypothetical protein
MRPFTVDGATVAPSARGLKIIRSDPYWVASDDAVTRGYKPRTVRLHYALTFTSSDDAIAVRGERHELEALAKHCERLWIEMLEWLGDPDLQSIPIFDGTVKSLIECYQKDPDSPFHDLRQSTRSCYGDWCTTLTRAVGARRVDRLTGRDFRKMFKEIMAPAEAGGRPRVRLATGCVKQMLPILFSYGVEIGIEACGKLLAILDNIILRVPDDVRKEWNERKPAQLPMEYGHARAIVDEGIRRGDARSLSVAIGVAAQFEFTIAQIDVIGCWETIERGEVIPPDAIAQGKSVWRPGLCYEDFLTDRILDMRRSKNNRGGTFEIDEYALFLRALEAIPAERRRGPVAIDSDGRPFDRWSYRRAYREIADTCGVPQAVWNMNARHGGATEADDAGAELQDISTHLQHGNTQTTKKHYIRPTSAPTKRVARKRAAHRAKKESA